MNIHPLAGKPASEAAPVDLPRLVSAYYTERPDPGNPVQRVAFGTSGHRGSALRGSFNESHVLAVTRAICDYRSQRGYDGPLYVGFDTHALSTPAFATVLEVLAAASVHALIAPEGAYTPTPALSHAILTFNRDRASGLADGIVITPSHNPPEDGGIKYNPPNGGPADTDVTRVIEARANDLLATGVERISRVPYARALRADSTHRHDFMQAYVDDLGSVIDMDAIRSAAVRMGVDPLGGAGVHYWKAIAERYGIELTVVDEQVDPAFRFMTLDWDGRIRMDPSSAHAMRRLIALKSRFDVAFACDTDHDRHGIVAPSTGLMPSNQYLAVAVDYLFRNRPHWSAQAAVGKTVVSSAMIDRAAAALGRRLHEVPAGFKWFVEGLLGGELGFGGEESAGATFARRDGSVWTTDKDGISAALLAAEMTARTKRDPGELYRSLAETLGVSYATRVDARATPAQKKLLSKLSPDQIRGTELAGEPIDRVLSRAPGNDAPIGGIKVVTANGWFAARPSGTEDIYKIYAESFRGEDHLQRIVREAQEIVDATIGAA